MVMLTQPALSPSMSARIAKATTLSPSSFRKRYISFYDTPSPSLSLTLPIRKRYQEDEGFGLEDEGPGLVEKEEEAAPKAVEELLGLGYGALRRHELVVEEGEIPSTFEVGQSSRVYTDIVTYVPPAAAVQTPPSPEWSSGSLENHDSRRQITKERCNRLELTDRVARLERRQESREEQ
nr:hypothetical protein [Tanacetum cinerariifolium]